MARESCRERNEDLAVACRIPSKIFREVGQDVRATVRVSLALNAGISVMQIASERQKVHRNSLRARYPAMIAKLLAVLVFKRLLDDAKQHKGAACAWDKMLDTLATTSDVVRRAFGGDKSQGLGHSWGRVRLGAVVEAKAARTSLVLA